MDRSFGEKRAGQLTNQSTVYLRRCGGMLHQARSRILSTMRWRGLQIAPATSLLYFTCAVYVSDGILLWIYILMYSQPCCMFASFSCVRTEQIPTSFANRGVFYKHSMAGFYPTSCEILADTLVQASLTVRGRRPSCAYTRASATVCDKIPI